MFPRKVIKGKKVDFQVLSRDLAGSARPKVPHIVISITISDKTFCSIPSNDDRLGLLRIKFDDIDNVPRNAKYEDKVVFNEEHAKKIADFVKEHLVDAELIVINCEAGRSRSAGVAMALHKWIEGGRGIFNREFSPNQRVYSILRKELTGE